MIFIDTGAFLARYLPRDRHHEDARQVWGRLVASRQRLFTSSFVLDEFFTLLARKAGYRFAAERARKFYGSSRVQVLRPSLNDEMDGLDYFEKFADQKVSFTDCVSFSLMKGHRIRRAFTFDQHFALTGFEIVRK